MKHAILTSLIPFLPNDVDVAVSPLAMRRTDASHSTSHSHVEDSAGRIGPPDAPYMLRNHRIAVAGDGIDRDWWVRRDYGETLGPASRRSLDSVVYQIYKEKDEGRRRDAFWTDWFSGDGDNSSSSLPEDESPSNETLSTSTASYSTLANSTSSYNETSSNETSASSVIDETTRPGNPIPLPSNIDPTNFSPAYVPPVGDIEQEFMVVSGGFTDTDWTSFPVWAFDMGEPATSAHSSWRDLTGLDVGAETPSEKDTSTDTLVWPPGRVGHVSALYDGALYVFGGMLWKDKAFVVEEAPYVWKTKVEHKLKPSNESLSNTSVLEWERIMPTVKYYRDVHDEDPPPSNTSSSYDVPSQWEDMTLTRGECRGGHWAEGSALVFYGGLHVQHQLSGHHKDKPEDVALGDVWLYNYTSETMEQISPYPPPLDQRDGWGRYPMARTAHAATVVGNSLVIYGGMTSSAWSTSRGVGDVGMWEELSDIWVFDLVERKWSKRFVTPDLSRSYHTMVGWKDGSLGVFGGFRTARTISGEPIAFVFSDTLVSHPNDPTWWKAVDDKEGESIYDLSASNRLEHTSALDKFGSMYVWGGRFKTVTQIHGMWSLDVFNADSTVEFEEAPPDGLEAYEAELEALHMLVAVMLLMSVFFTALYGTLRRQAIENETTGGGNGGILGRRRGLTPETIDALPVKTYESSPGASEANTESESDAGGLSDIALEEDCCPICLVEYEPGDEMRLLPCNHEFHKVCVDSWLENNASCPACRHALSNNAPDNSRGESDVDGIWRVNQRLDVPSMIPPVTLAQVLQWRELGWFGVGDEDAFSGRSHVAPTRSSDDTPADDNAEEDEHEVRSRRRSRFSRYFSLPTHRDGHRSEEASGETEMTEIGGSFNEHQHVEVV